jgi:hypothetical protein
VVCLSLRAYRTTQLPPGSLVRDKLLVDVLYPGLDTPLSREDSCPLPARRLAEPQSGRLPVRQRYSSKQGGTTTRGASGPHPVKKRSSRRFTNSFPYDSSGAVTPRVARWLLRAQNLIYAESRFHFDLTNGNLTREERIFILYYLSANPLQVRLGLDRERTFAWDFGHDIGVQGGPSLARTQRRRAPPPPEANGQAWAHGTVLAR